MIATLLPTDEWVNPNSALTRLKTHTEFSPGYVIPAKKTLFDKTADFDGQP